MYSRSPATLDYRLLYEKTDKREKRKEKGLNQEWRGHVENNVWVRQVPQDSRELEAEEAKK